jgi:hypothetical protein
VLLETPAQPVAIKEWCKLRNLEQNVLRGLTTLSANGLTLKYPLDISTNQNDKPLFIAPPMVEGLIDPLDGRRIELHIRKKPRLSLEFKTAGNVYELIDRRVAELRLSAGLRKKSAPKYKTIQGAEVLTNPDRVSVTGIKEARGFVYLNLNGGDSWAYYFHTEKPELLCNFKGEPPVLLKSVAPDVYAQYGNALAPAQDHNAEKTIPFVFRDIPTDQYYTALWNRETQDIELNAVGSLIKVQHFMIEHGHEPPSAIESWTIEFNPTTFDRIRPEQRWINTFRPTKYLLTDYEAVYQIPPIIDRVLNSLLSDQESKSYFLNWLASIYQTREKTQTGWVFSGTTGTGKGILFQRILTPLFGSDHVVSIVTDNLEEKFNSYLVRALIVFIDELQSNDSKATNRMVERLKNATTEEIVPIRLMRSNPINMRVYNNFIAATNHPDPIPIAPNDRRLSFAPWQDNQLVITKWEVEQGIATELEQFAAFLQHYAVDQNTVTESLKNETRDKMIVASRNTVDSFFQALHDGNIDYLLDLLDGPVRLIKGAPDLTYKRVYDTVQRWASSPEQEQKIPRDDLEEVFNYFQDKSTGTSKFSRMCKIHKLDVKPIRYEGLIRRGITVKFKRSAYENLIVEESANVAVLRTQRDAKEAITEERTQRSARHSR